jgi:hypothetical protein
MGARIHSRQLPTQQRRYWRGAFARSHAATLAVAAEPSEDALIAGLRNTQSTLNAPYHIRCELAGLIVIDGQKDLHEVEHGLAVNR